MEPQIIANVQYLRSLAFAEWTAFLAWNGRVGEALSVAEIWKTELRRIVAGLIETNEELFQVFISQLLRAEIWSLNSSQVKDVFDVMAGHFKVADELYINSIPRAESLVFKLYLQHRRNSELSGYQFHIFNEKGEFSLSQVSSGVRLACEGYLATGHDLASWLNGLILSAVGSLGHSENGQDSMRYLLINIWTELGHIRLSTGETIIGPIHTAKEVADN